jgi:hypothetical protein
VTPEGWAVREDGMTTRQSLAPRRREPQGLGRLAWVLCLAAEGMAAACVVLLLAGQVSVGDAVNAYLVTNLGMVVTFAAVCGLVAGNRPENPIGWLFLAHSGCFAVATLAGRSRSPSRPPSPPAACVPCSSCSWDCGRRGSGWRCPWPCSCSRPAAPSARDGAADRADGHQRAGLRRPDPAGPGRHGGHRPPSPSVDPPGRLPRR